MTTLENTDVASFVATRRDKFDPHLAWNCWLPRTSWFEGSRVAGIQSLHLCVKVDHLTNWEQSKLHASGPPRPPTFSKIARTGMVALFPGLS
jgi:hypothetical protein